MAQEQPTEQTTQSSAKPKGNFPDPSITLIEFGDALGFLLGMQTEKDNTQRRLILRKAAYVRIDESGWGVSGFKEVWIQQNKTGIFLAIDAATRKAFRYPSKRHYEFGFLSKDVFACAAETIKQGQVQALLELLLVVFGDRPDFSVEGGGLLGPEDYAAETALLNSDQMVPLPPPK